MASQSSSAPQPASLSVSFLVIGGGVGGLACALALTRIGHKVTVLEKGDGTSIRGEGGVRLPPNLTKILFHWGLAEHLLSKAYTTNSILFTRYETGDMLGKQVWCTELLKEAGGEFSLISHSELHKMLHDAVLAAGVVIRTNAEVTELDMEARQVVLASGEVLSADVFVGADGEFGLCRAAVAGEQRSRGTATGIVMYQTVIRGQQLPPERYEEMKAAKDAVRVAFGSGRAMIVYPIHKGKDFALQVYRSDECVEGRYGSRPSVELSQLPLGCRPLLQDLTDSASTAVRLPIRDHRDLEDWVDDEGRLVLIGEAAHPFVPGSIQATAMAIEDGAVLAKLFSHLIKEDQIESFLYAFQELRQARTATVRATEFGNVFYMISEDGESDMWIRLEDEADNWWVEWGLLRERARQQNDGLNCAPSFFMGIQALA
ncbi:3-hydroxybenzoate 6-hydroxylase 1 [Grifola frondosa]|uniref:3-hydroxybenzoate 6-hydroxylase 1 n=1 Tax=Grifola frondosa TaxID=5627 RepID=A0A1C7M6L0_GRIFR|nr:3-hydroxybenzoate 6-hydroxylase 1 [Grifola frondosa]